MGIADTLGLLFPRTTARYLLNRRLYHQAQRLYEATAASQWRPSLSNLTSGDGVMNLTGSRLRETARHMDENHDLVVSIFDDLIANIVGTGAHVAPMVRNRNGELDEDTNRQIREAWDEWSQSPETTGELGLEALERLTCRSYLRDGEVFIHAVNDSRFNFRTPVPLVLEMLEADYVPFLFSDESQNILHGIQCNAWGQPTFYHVYKVHPGDPAAAITFNTATGLKRIGNNQMLHLKFTRRLRQRRGVPIIHAVINRMRDLLSYEQSEIIAAKVASDMTAFIERTSEYNVSTGSADIDADQRQLQMSAGSIFTLLPGEKVSTIKSERPNTHLLDFRNAMLRAVAGGTGTRFSSIAKSYDGTYSAQRQELVEGAVSYRQHFSYLERRFYRPVYQRFLTAALVSGRVVIPPTADPVTAQRVDFRAPALPWIDPAKEAAAWQTLIDAKLESHAEIIRQRGRDPAKVAEEIAQEQDSDVWGNQLALALPQLPAAEPDEDEETEAA